jgi:hypothetical protein
MDDSLSRIACSYRPQATIVGVTNQAFRRLDAQGAPIILQVHDSLALEINVSAIVETATQVEAAFNHPITLHGRTFVIPIDLQIGLNWGELREYNEKEDRTSYGVNIAN